MAGAGAAIGSSFLRQVAAAELKPMSDIDIDSYRPYVYDRVSDAEFVRRHRAIRQFMQQEHLDCLLIAGGTGTWDRNWTNTRWAVNHVGAQLTNYSYVVFPLEGEPSVLVFPIVAWLPARRAREIVDDVRPTTDPAKSAVERINELGLPKGRIGIVETDLYTSIPHVHHQTFTQELPGVDWQTVTRQWWRALRLVRSEEEISFIERSARIGDVMTAALADVLQPGVSEQALFGTLYDAMARAGGETPAMVLAASGPSYSDFDIFQRERHMNRVLGVGDVVVTELGPRYPDGSECQTGRAYALGRPSRRYQEMGAVMLDAYDRVVDTFRPGKTDADVVKAAGVIKDAGYTWLSPLVHAPEGGATGALPHIASGVDQPEEKRVTFAPNMVMCVQIHVGLPDYSAGVFMADTWAITEKDPRCLNQYPREFVIVG
jgi:Xaa-Pro aminopeptidase